MKKKTEKKIKKLENKAEKKNKRHFFKKKKSKTDQIIRIEELEALMEQEGGDVDPEKIVSMYRPHRKRRQIGAALLRLDKLSLALLAMLVTVGILFAAAFMQEKMGNFTINLDRLEMYRRDRT